MKSVIEALFLFITLFLVVGIRGGELPTTVQVVNNVDPCSNGNYADTIKLFFTNYAQENVAEGATYTVQSSQFDASNGLGIQENGMYCRSGGDESGCINPDNAGMQMVYTTANCSAYQLNNPFYCGVHPPNAKSVVAIAASGTWPNCVVTLTRLSSAPVCQYTCSSSSSSSSSSSPSASTTGASSASASATSATSDTSAGEGSSTASLIACNVITLVVSVALLL